MDEKKLVNVNVYFRVPDPNYSLDVRDGCFNYYWRGESSIRYHLLPDHKLSKGWDERSITTEDIALEDGSVNAIVYSIGHPSPWDEEQKGGFVSYKAGHGTKSDNSELLVYARASSTSLRSRNSWA